MSPPLDFTQPFSTTCLSNSSRLARWPNVTHKVSGHRSFTSLNMCNTLSCHIPELEFHILKYFLTSYSPSTQFLAFRSIWGLWNWFQMIPHARKHWICHQNHVSSMLRSWVRISHLEVLLDLLQPVHSVLGIQVDLRLLKLVPNDSSCTKTLVLPPEPCF